MKNHTVKGKVEFEHVSKRYRLGTLGTLRGTISSLLSKDSSLNDWRRVLWALRDVTFRVAPGDSLGLIGPNGSGKTTALKLLSNITQPTVGRVAVQGRVASLIELGAGFHPELTGRENIHLNGAILG
ncbi:MAG: ATP-binding cassette domain-containing protein, partial [bacterium]